jgi:hypothetical protein
MREILPDLEMGRGVRPEARENGILRAPERHAIDIGVACLPFDLVNLLDPCGGSEDA